MVLGLVLLDLRAAFDSEAIGCECVKDSVLRDHSWNVTSPSPELERSLDMSTEPQMT